MGYFVPIKLFFWYAFSYYVYSMKRTTQELTQPVIAQMVLSRKISDRRKALGLTQSELSEMSGVRKATIVNVEKGMGYNAKTLFSLLFALGGDCSFYWKNKKIKKGKP